LYDRLQLALKEISPTTLKDRGLEAVSVDTSESEKVFSDALAGVVKKFGTVDVLVNCAGTSVAGEFCDLDIKEFDRMM
jgi:3-dehydrosphinganine reductase